MTRTSITERWAHRCHHRPATTITDDEFNWVCDALTLTLYARGWNRDAIAALTSAVERTRSHIVGNPQTAGREVP